MFGVPTVKQVFGHFLQFPMNFTFNRLKNFGLRFPIYEKGDDLPSYKMFAIRFEELASEIHELKKCISQMYPRAPPPSPPPPPPPMAKHLPPILKSKSSPATRSAITANELQNAKLKLKAIKTHRKELSLNNHQADKDVNPEFMSVKLRPIKRLRAKRQNQQRLKKRLSKCLDLSRERCG